jgi:transglutaminase-like putative cysteine protease
MDYLIGLSLNCNGFPTILSKNTSEDHYSKFGFASYSLSNYYSTIIKNIKVENQSNLIERLYQNNLTGISTFLGCEHLKIVQEEQNAPPFHWVFAGRIWTLVCDLDLKSDFKINLALSERSIFSPVGNTDGEYLLCWLLEVIYSKGATSLADLSWAALHGVFQSISQFGYADILLSDGQDLVAYHDANTIKPFYAIRNSPPHEENTLKFEKMDIRLEGPDLNHTIVLFTNQSPELSYKNMVLMNPGQMIVVRNADFIWDSHELTGELFTTTDMIQTESTPKENHHPISLTNPLTLHEIHLVPLITAKQESKTYPSICLNSYMSDENVTLYSIYHSTFYQYDAPIGMSKHLLRLQPIHDLNQHVLHYKLTASVNGKTCNFSGVFGNNATILDVTDSYTDLEFVSQSIIAISDPAPQRYDLLHQQSTLPLVWMPWDHIMLQAYLTPPELAESELFELFDYAMSFVKRNNNCVIDVLNDINRTIYRDYTYSSGSTDLSTTPFQVYVSRQGVCQDFANLFICLARLLSIPARYRVGYIYTGTDYENKQQGDASHAWVELYLPNLGWIGFDPTNCCLQSHNHIRVACGRNYRDATPTSGTIFRGGGHETLHTAVHVVKLSIEEMHEKLADQLKPL